MKLVITTTFENVDQEWLDWYLERLRVSKLLPGNKLADDIKNKGSALFESKDDTSKVVGSTKYDLQNGIILDLKG